MLFIDIAHEDAIMMAGALDTVFFMISPAGLPARDGVPVEMKVIQPKCTSQTSPFDRFF
nr:hypothetical protein [Candidatus Sigynarchaeota archaeon]